MDIEELNTTNDDGTGLIRTDSDNDIIIGRKNADDKMYLESIIGYDDGKGMMWLVTDTISCRSFTPASGKREKRDDKNHVQKCNAYRGG